MAVWREIVIWAGIGFAGGAWAGMKVGWYFGLLRLGNFEIRQRRSRARW